MFVRIQLATHLGLVCCLVLEGYLWIRLLQRYRAVYSTDISVFQKFTLYHVILQETYIIMVKVFLEKTKTGTHVDLLQTGSSMT